MIKVILPVVKTKKKKTENIGLILTRQYHKKKTSIQNYTKNDNIYLSDSQGNIKYPQNQATTPDVVSDSSPKPCYSSLR